MMTFVRTFIMGGFICLIGQILIDRVNITSGKILVIFVVSGVILTALGLYEPLIKWGGAGATVPLTGFGYSLAKGAIDGVKDAGIMGAFYGGIKNTATGITGAILFGYINAVLFKPKNK